MTTPKVIQLNNIVLKYGNYTAIDNVSVDLAEGEFFALLGPSGCGKSSLLRIVAGFVEPNSGEVLLDGKDMTNVPARRRPINMMFQSYALFPHMSVEQNVRYGLEMARLPSAEIKQRVAEILETTHLTTMAGRRPNQLSGGQRQRVALARALVMRPRVLLLDEPLGALDKKLREAMQLELKRLQHEMGLTFVVVTHDQEEALVMADRIALMRAGKIEQVGTAAELYERPASKFVADFIGRTNFFDGVAKGRKIGVQQLGELTGDVDAVGTVTYSIRPEWIRLYNDRPADFDNCLEGVVEEVNYHGQNENVLVRLPGQSQLVTALRPANQMLPVTVSRGGKIWLAWNGKDSRVLSQ
ncbi:MULTISPECIES: ABC transporter ATP-binding protein [Rhizobium]|uniref:Spermidine/putrescine import ATP-binding protein PotA n=2 Tax=Rhizobium TaxID=379 RepID=K0PTF1_9HYPH|nr:MULTISPECIES: ABC transporter ATP-binding protein [Rhizobium]KWV43443.1 spermidine/putrescine ABC transporter ATP-binding protein [Rhizobium altiplani]CCM80021.1 putrescine transporter subunit: ATP-binding component of ABC superfamily [Rhizobium mesoamericanum STM3625]